MAIYNIPTYTFLQQLIIVNNGIELRDFNLNPSITGQVEEIDINGDPVELDPIENLYLYVDPENYQSQTPPINNLTETGLGTFLELTKQRKITTIKLIYDDYDLFTAITLIAKKAIDTKTPLTIIDYVCYEPIEADIANKYTTRTGFIQLPLRLDTGLVKEPNYMKAIYNNANDQIEHVNITKYLMPTGFGFTFEENSLSYI